jgi:hypothetical protein
VRGLHDEAVARAAQAVETAERLPHNPNARGIAWAAAAEVRQSAGDTEGAREALTRALDAYTEKGNLVAAERLRAAAAHG